MEMGEWKKTLGRILFYYLLLLVNGILSNGFITDHFPFRNAPTFFLLALSICLVLYYRHRVTSKGRISLWIKGISWMALSLILFRAIKYSAFSNVDVLARHSWYCYYIPILSMPLFLFLVSLLVSGKEESFAHKKWVWLFYAITISLIVLTLTNDLHQQVFSFHEGFAGWNDDYSHGWLFYVINVWQFSLYVASIVILIIKCRVSSSKKNAWVILIPALIGTLMYVLLLLGAVPKIAGSTLFEFPEAHIFTVIVVIECCMQLGLVPTNSDYKKVFQSLSIPAEITDEKGHPVFISGNAAPLSKEEFLLESGSRIQEHVILYKMKLPGGYGFWQDEVSGLDFINEQLSEAKEGLEQETEIIRLRNELEQQQLSIKQRALIYDQIAKSTSSQSKAISELAKKARESDDPKQKDAHRKKIVLLGCYIKRYANLMLLCQERSDLELGELELSISEFLHYLNYYGIPGELIGEKKGRIASRSALALFETIESLIENNLDCLNGVFVNFLPKEGGGLKLVLEGSTSSIEEAKKKHLEEAGVSFKLTQEDEVSYWSFFFLLKEEKQ